MLQLPAQLANQSVTYIGQQSIPSGQHRYYLKWLRYYLDFCHKYDFPHSEPRSLAAFKDKLKEKHQAEHLRNQAHHAVILFQTMESDLAKTSSHTNKHSDHIKTPLPDKSHNRKNLRNQDDYSGKKVSVTESTQPFSDKNSCQSKIDWPDCLTD